MTAPQAKSNYRPDIDGLRAVAVMAVVIHHLSASLLPGGYVGVDVFFVISGYLITRIISSEIEEGHFTFARFYERRARRIFPALFAVLAVTLLAGYFFLLPSDYVGTLRGALGTLLFASNIVFWRDMAAGYFAATDAGLNPLLHTWSLAVEEQFYMFFPVLLLLCYRYFRRHMVLVLAGCAVVSLTGAALLVQSKSVAVFFLSPFRAWELLVGSLLALNVAPALRSRFVREFTAAAGLLAILVPCFIYDEKTTFPGLTALAPVLGAAAILHAGANRPCWIGRLLEWRPVLYIGLISYSLYLWHWPLIVFVRYAMGMTPITQHIAALLVSSLILASVSYHFIEQPLRHGQFVTRQFIFKSCTLCASAFILVSGLGLASSGYADRFRTEVIRLDLARSPSIPYLHCDGAPVNSDPRCLLGSASSTTTMLLWGDSHMLAWGPALQKILTETNIRGIFTPNHSCPPIFGVNNKEKPECRAHNYAVKDYILSDPNINTIVMSAHWSAYFKEDGPLTATEGAPPAHGNEATRNALTYTIQWLQDNGRRVVLIGPVPVYESSVPLSLALEKATDRRLVHASMDDQHRMNAAFYEAINTVKNKGRDGASFSFLDPIQWMCAEDCMVTKDGIPLYRDSHHLSEAGAMALLSNISEGLAKDKDPKQSRALPSTTDTLNRNIDQ